MPGGLFLRPHVLRLPREAVGTVVHDPERGVLLLGRHRFITDSCGWEDPAWLLADAILRSHPDASTDHVVIPAIAVSVLDGGAEGHEHRP